MKQFNCFSVLCFLPLFLAVVSASLPTEYDIIFSHVVHREGARLTDVRTDDSFLCGKDYPCGALTPTGESMIGSLGSFLKTRYSGTRSAESVFFPFDAYNVSVIDSQSSAIKRNLQSASALLLHLFPATSSPAISSTNVTTDLLLHVESLPRSFIRKHVDPSLQEQALRGTVQKFFTIAQLRAMAAEVHASAECTSNTRLYGCAFALYDIAVAFQSAGRLTEADTPLLLAGFEELKAIHAEGEAWLYGYNADDADDRVQGAMAQPLAQEVVAKMKEIVAAQGSTVQRLQHYAVSESELSAFTAVLGDQTAETFSSSFGSAVLVELLQHKTNGTFAVHVERVKPSSSFSIDFSYEESEVKVMCWSASASAPYVATDGTCGFDDFVAHVDHSKATKENGWCELSAAEQRSLNCGKTRAEPPSAYCLLYRSLCPAVACAEGFVLNAANLNCVRLFKADSCNEDHVVLSQVVHEFGVRTPEVSENQAQICGSRGGCGKITNYGEEMLYAMGDHLRDRYNDISIVDDYFFPEGIYDSSLVYSRSTGFQYTLQSAAAFLAGLFPEESLFYPVIYSANTTTDFLLLSSPHPMAMLKDKYNEDGEAKELNPVSDTYFTFTTLQKISEELYMSSVCTNEAYRGRCAKELYTVAAYMEASGKLTDKPQTAASMEGLEAVSAAWFDYMYNWNAMDVLMKTQGSVAQDLAQQLLANIHAHLVSPSYKMFEYSTHDTMISPLSILFGADDESAYRPQFGESLLVELVQRGSDQFLVRVVRGRPDLSDEGDVVFSTETFPLRCVNEAGELYRAENSTCPLDDFIRMVDYSKPAESNGNCVMDRTLYDNMRCPETYLSPEVLTQDCELFRIACPYHSCPTDYILFAGDFQCYPIKSPDPEPGPDPPEPGPTPDLPKRLQVAARKPDRAAQRRQAAKLVIGVTTGVAIGAAIHS